LSAKNINNDITECIRNLAEETASMESGQKGALIYGSESPIEEIFADTIGNFLNKNVRVYPQYLVEKPNSPMPYRIDFVLQNAKRSVGIECDGKEYHADFMKDFHRDEMIVHQSKSVDVIYRFRGIDLNWFPYGCMRVLSLWEQGLFSERGLHNIEKLSDGEYFTETESTELSDILAKVTYIGLIPRNEYEEEDGRFHELSVLRRDSLIPASRWLGGDSING
jgi:hypothetical protein